MPVCKANDVRTELMKTGYLPQANEACFIPIVPQTEKLNLLVMRKKEQQHKLRIICKARGVPKGILPLTVCHYFSVNFCDS